VGDLIRMLVQPVLRDPALILAFEGWNDAGQAATSALRYVDASLHTAPLADVDPDEFYDFTVRRPQVVRGEGGRRRIVWPANAFRYGSVGPSRELVTGCCIEPHVRWRRFCEVVADLAESLAIRRAVLIGAFQTDVIYSQPVRVTGFATDPVELDRLGVSKSDYEGPTGIVGVLTSHLEDRGLSVLSLWAGLPHYINVAPNPRGSLALIQALTRHLGFRLDEGPLRAGAAEFEQKISRLVAADAELADYVKELKRREFAQ
jgi:hypothetical protein